jgi:uncharacterized protein (TIGR01777 family)
MKIVLPAGTGNVGAVLLRHWSELGHELVVLSRNPRGLLGGVRRVAWDARTLGPWASEIDGADVVVNLAGKSVGKGRYTDDVVGELKRSRVDSVRVVGEAIARANKPPKLWLQMSTAALYAHRFDGDNDEATGLVGGNEPGVPAYWSKIVDVALSWERALADAVVPSRKVALRLSLLMSPDRGSVFDVFYTLARTGLGGSIAGGAQYVSWIHDADFVSAIDWLIDRDDVDGVINLASPSPLPQREFMRSLREAARAPIGLPASKWMVSLGARVAGADPELMLKSRRVTPGRLLERGFAFRFPSWPEAARDLVARIKAR